MAPCIDDFSYPHKTSEYTYRIPTPPRIVVPPPPLNASALPQITLNALCSADFLNNISYCNIVSQNAVQEWSYHRRRQAQMILPHLYLGPMPVAKDESFLKGITPPVQSQQQPRELRPITMVIGVRQKYSFKSTLMNGALDKARELGVECHTFDLANDQDLIHSFPQTTALINEHLARVHSSTNTLGRVLVCCESGNERSAGIAAAYLMETYVDVDYIKAMQLVQAQRFCVTFDDHMKTLLQGYWDILCAKRQVDAANAVHVNEPGTGRCGQSIIPSGKRSLRRDSEDELMNGIDDDDMERFGARTFAPFEDQPF